MPSTPAAPLTVYIAEDNPILLQGLERALTAHGYEVATAVDGRAMMELLDARGRPDILLLDVMMPRMTGIEVFDAVRANPEMRALPVMLITAAAEEAVSGRELDQREVNVLMKPFRLSELLARIEEQVRGGGEDDVSTIPLSVH